MMPSFRVPHAAAAAAVLLGVGVAQAADAAGIVGACSNVLVLLHPLAG
jgi:hypothetical protein